MKVIETGFEGLRIIEPDVWSDTRGYFFEAFQRQRYTDNNINVDFVQDNESKSSHGVLRGLHYQLPPMAQAKLVRVIHGSVLDVVVDIRPHSRTYGKWFSMVLDDQKKAQLFIPEGFAHGYVVRSASAIFAYKCNRYYSREHEAGIHYKDATLNIDWEMREAAIQLSEKDRLLPAFGQHKAFE